MKRTTTLRPLLALVAIVLLSMSGCGREGNSSVHSHGAASSGGEAKFAGDYPIRVVCTIGPITDMLRNVGGEHLDVAGLMPPGIDPHGYSATPSDIEKLHAADAIFYNGLHLEGRMADFFERLARRKSVVAVTARLVETHDDRLRTPPEFEGLHDPHVWHDPMLWSDCVEYVVDWLAEFDPKNAATYQAGGEAYRRQLVEVDTYCRDRIATIPADRRVLVTAHDAFGYFSKAYGIETQALKGISTQDEADIGRMEDIVKLLIERKIPAVFVESAVAPRIVEALVEPCRARGHELEIGGELYADALGPKGSSAETYTGMMRANVDTIVAALGRD